MNSPEELLHRDIEEFNLAVNKLIKGVNQKDISWDDSEFQKLRESISVIAQSTKSVKDAADNCESALQKFERIASEV